jgi:hypothetical protein
MRRHWQPVGLVIALLALGATVLVTVRLADRGDTDEMMFPDPGQLTMERLRSLRQVIDENRDARSAYVDSLMSVEPKEHAPEGESFRYDGWNHPIRYHRTDRAYELRSAGPDGVFETPDDIVLAGPGPRPRS